MLLAGSISLYFFFAFVYQFSLFREQTVLNFIKCATSCSAHNIMYYTLPHKQDHVQNKCISETVRGIGPR